MFVGLFSKILPSLFLACLYLPEVAESVPTVTPDEITNFVTVNPKILDFGQVNESEKQVSVSLTLKNYSKHDVNIVSVKTGCGCASIKLPQSTLEAGAFISIPVTVNISGRRGKFEESVRIEIAGYKDQIITVPIKGTIVHDIWFEQPMIWCSVKESEMSAESEFEIHTVDFPNVQFDLKLHEEALSINEIKRTKIEGQTTGHL